MFFTKPEKLACTAHGISLIVCSQTLSFLSESASNKATSSLVLVGWKPFLTQDQKIMASTCQWKRFPTSSLRRLTLSEVEAIKFGSRSPSGKAASTDKPENDQESETSVYVIEDDSFTHEDSSRNYNESLQAGLQTRSNLDTTSTLENGSDHRFDLTDPTTTSYQQEVR